MSEIVDKRTCPKCGRKVSVIARKVQPTVRYYLRGHTVSMANKTPCSGSGMECRYGG